MERGLTISIWLWVAAQVVIDLTLAWHWRSDVTAGFGPAMFMDGLRLMNSRTAAARHLALPAGNVIAAVPAVAVAVWRDQLRARNR